MAKGLFHHGPDGRKHRTTMQKAQGVHEHVDQVALEVGVGALVRNESGVALIN